LFACAFCLSAASLASACGSDDGKKTSPDRLPPGGDGGQGIAGETNVGNAPSGGSGGSGGSAGSGAELGGAGGDAAEPGGAGGVPPTGSAGEPPVGGVGGVGGEGNEGGAGGSGGEAPTGNVLYATFGTKLVWLEPDTGKLHEVGDMRSAAGDVTYSEVLLAYGNVPGEARIITPRYDSTANRPPPELGKLDLCTGVVSELTPLTRVPTAPTAIEGLARHPNGTWYIATGTYPAGVMQNISDKLGTLNAATSVVTDLAGMVDTLQNDIDAMTFVGTTMYAMDVSTGTSQIELVTANLTTGAVTSVAIPASASASATPLRLAYDGTRSKAYSWRQSDRNLLELSLVNGAVTPIGETHGINVYPGESVQGFTSAPICP
jgi:hypothetical protein